MKSKLVIAGLIVMAAVMLASLSSAMAYDWFPILTASNDGHVWQFNTMKDFSGKDVYPTSIVAEYWVTVDGVTTTTTIYPERVHLAGSQVKLFFDSAILPDSADGNRVTGTLADGTTFLATGPGWAWGGIHV